MKFSSEPPTAALFCGEIETSRLKFSSEIKKFDRDQNFDQDPIFLIVGPSGKVTERAQNADFRRKPQIFADSPLLLEIPAFGGRRKPQIFAGNRRFSQKTAGNRRLGSVTLGASPLAWPSMPFSS